MAQITIGTDYDILGILSSAGIDPATTPFLIRVDQLIVPGGDQSALDAALAAYDHKAHLIALKWATVRSNRDDLLAGSDWSILPDSPLTTTKIDEWKVYRQTLRDLPQTQTAPFNITWPTKPA